jgi:hypothetical protein
MIRFAANHPLLTGLVLLVVLLLAGLLLVPPSNWLGFFGI